MSELVVAAMDRVGIATLVPKPGQGLAGRIEQLFGLTLASGPRRSVEGRHSLVGTGPDSWLWFHDDASNDWVETLSADLADVAYVVDQTGAWVLLELRGAGAQTLLARAVSIDVESFTIGSSAMTVIGHIGVLIWRGEAGYGLAVPRSYEAAFWHWLETATAALGVALAHG